MNFDIRKQLLDFDNVMNKQREAVYDLRNDILDGEDFSGQIKDMISEAVEEKLAVWCPEGKHAEEWDLSSLKLWLERSFELKVDLEQAADRDAMKDAILEAVDRHHADREEQFGKDAMREMERMILLQMIDTAWKEHLYDLDHLKKGINLRAYGQKDPKIEYQKESFALFEQMMGRIRDSAIEYIFKLKMVPAPQRKAAPRMQEQKPEFTITRAVEASFEGESVPEFKSAPSPGNGRPFSPGSAGAQTPVPSVGKIGRNDPCICGSGKKYKKCCGKSE
jgi:preprotein translocase subunit SecA